MYTPKEPKWDTSTRWRVSPLCDIETPEVRYEPGSSGGQKSASASWVNYIRSKNPGLPPNGWKDVTPYFGKKWPKSLSAWRGTAKKNGFYVSVQLVRPPDGSEPYRAILVCLLAK